MKLAQNHKVAIKVVTAKFMEKSAIRYCAVITVGYVTVTVMVY